MNELGVHRAFMQAVAGIHRNRNLPKFQRRDLLGVVRKRGPTARRRRDPATPAPTRKVALFATCSVEYYEPATGRAAVRVLERNRVDVSVPPQRCCGMPYLDGGAVDEAKALIRDNVKSLAAAVREGREIVVPGPTCSYMLKQEYPWLDGSEDAQLVAANTRDLFEYLARLQAAGALDTRFSRPVGAVTYHVPCHLRAQNIGHEVGGRAPRHSRRRGRRGREVLRGGRHLGLQEGILRAVAPAGEAALRRDRGRRADRRHRLSAGRAPDRAGNGPTSRSIRSRSSRTPTDSRSDGVKPLERFRDPESRRVRKGPRRAPPPDRRAEEGAPSHRRPYLTFVFENRETVWFQIQEMVRAERIVDEAKIAEEVEVYNALLPKPGELAATLMIEIEEAAQIKPVLDRLLGIDTGDYVTMTVDGRP